MYNPMLAKQKVCFLLHFLQGVDVKTGLAAIGASDIISQREHCIHMQAPQMPILHADRYYIMSIQCSCSCSALPLSAWYYHDASKATSDIALPASV